MIAVAGCVTAPDTPMRIEHGSPLCRVAHGIQHLSRHTVRPVRPGEYVGRASPCSYAVNHPAPAGGTGDAMRCAWSLIFLIPVWLSGCGTPRYSDASGQGRGQPELNADMQRCNLEGLAITGPPIPYQCDSGCLTANIFETAIERASYYNSCMAAAGWQREANNSGSAPNASP